MDIEQKSSPTISEGEPDFLINRVALVAEVIPLETWENLNNGELWIFLQEPNPEKWPPSMNQLKKYVALEE